MTDPAKTLERANSLLDTFDVNQAMAYFVTAGEEYSKNKNWEMAGLCFSKSAYCYEMDGRYDLALKDYQIALDYYQKANLPEKVQEINVELNRMKNEGIFMQKKQLQKIIVGAVGLNGSGKDMLLKILETKYGVPMVSYGDVVRDIAKEEGREATRDNLHEISTRYFRDFGIDVFAKRLVKKIEDNNWRVAGVSGIRTPTDAGTFRDFYGDEFVLVLVEISDPHVRFERLKARGETRDPKEYQDFVKQDESEKEIFQLNETMSTANVKILNDGTIDDFERAVDEFAAKIGLSSIK